MARGHILAQSCDANGNVVDRAFAGGKVKKLTTNIILKSMYTQ